LLPVNGPVPIILPVWTGFFITEFKVEGEIRVFLHEISTLCGIAFDARGYLRENQRLKLLRT